MSNVEKAHTDKIIARGPGSVAIKLPAILAKRFGIEAGSVVDYYIDGNSLVLKFPKPGDKEEVF